MQLSEMGFVPVRETVRGCVRIRLYEFTTIDGELLFAVELWAWNNWVRDGKILLLASGLDRDYASERFAGLANTVRDFSWTDDELVMEG